MLEEVYKWIQNIAVYLVVVTAMLHAVPGKDYERYIRFFSGLVLIVLIFFYIIFQHFLIRVPGLFQFFSFFFIYLITVDCSECFFHAKHT